MNNENINTDKKAIFVCVDTQKDFMDADGKLYVTDAEIIKETLAKITKYAKDNNIQVITTSDWHYDDSLELSDNPDFINTFPPHCMVNSIGAELVAETKPDGFDFTFDWKEQFDSNWFASTNLSVANILILKDKFDVFVGNPNTDSIIKTINPEIAYVYGVAGNVCVNYAVLGLLERGIEVVVFEDAIKDLPNVPSAIESWVELGARVIKFN